jgi:phosphoglycolate phosphatase-like HAD superfamily hydrolase
MKHVVWDWNGTLFDDLNVVLAAVNRGVEPFGVPPVTLDHYRDHYTRPVKRFYDDLLGRELTPNEWKELDDRFHAGYRELLDHAQLSEDAQEALEMVAQRGITQSLLSMFPHDELVPLVERLRIAHYFDRIDGLRGEPGDAKAAYLEEHLRWLIIDEDPSTVLVVGDTPDDAVAAGHVGAQCVLVDNGSHHRHELEALLVPIAQNLVEALDMSRA